MKGFTRVSAITVILCVGFIRVASFAQPSTYQVMVHLPMAKASDPVNQYGRAIDLANVQAAVSQFHATGISLRVLWSEIEPSTQGTYDYTNLDKAINNIVKSQNLSLSIRLIMGGMGKPGWSAPGAGKFGNDDYVQIQSGTIYMPPPNLPQLPSDLNRTMSFSSPAFQSAAKSVFSSLTSHVASLLNSLNKANNLMDIEPVFASSEETTYPADQVPLDNSVDYSPNAITAFRAFLSQKYGTIQQLNSQWTAWTSSGTQTANFTNWAQIDPKSYDWNIWPGTKGWDITHYQYYVGRRDWYSFRQSQLKKCIDMLADIAHAQPINNTLGFIPFGVEPGNITQYWGTAASPMELQGWYDFTPLAEKVEWIHVAGTPEQGGGPWQVEADYLRSVCRYWTKTRNNPKLTVRFSDETNWPDYGTGGSNPVVPSGTPRAWKNAADQAQTDAYLRKGASAHFIYGWEVQLADLASWNGVFADFQGFRDYLGGKANSAVDLSNNSNVNAVYVSTSRLASDMGAFFPASGYTVGQTYYPYYHYNSSLGALAYDQLNARVPREILPTKDGVKIYDYPYYNLSNNDFVTDAMVNGNPGYVNSYNYIFMTNGSFHIYNDQYNGRILDQFLSKKITAGLVNATRYATGLSFPGERWWIIPGTQLFAGKSAQDVLRMIWRTSTTLDPYNYRWTTIWPQGDNLTTDAGVLSANGLPANWYDFVQFAVLNDVASVDMFQNTSVNYGNWDADAVSIWTNSGSDYQSRWPDRYNCANCAINSSSTTNLDFLKYYADPGVDSKWSLWPFSDK